MFYIIVAFISTEPTPCYYLYSFFLGSLRAITRCHLVSNKYQMHQNEILYVRIMITLEF